MLRRPRSVGLMAAIPCGHNDVAIRDTTPQSSGGAFRSTNPSIPPGASTATLSPVGICLQHLLRSALPFPRLSFCPHLSISVRLAHPFHTCTVADRDTYVRVVEVFFSCTSAYFAVLTHRQIRAAFGCRRDMSRGSAEGGRKGTLSCFGMEICVAVRLA